MTQTPEPYAIYAIKYAYRHATRAENMIFSDAHDAPMPLDYYVWVIVGKNRTFVVDTGFDEKEAAKRKRDLLRSPREALQYVAVDADKVEDVIITHMHYDHCGNLGQFPSAKLYLQEREMHFATGRRMREKLFRHSFCADYVVDIVHALYDDRVDYIDGAREIAPGVSVHHVGGHTHGLQVVRVWTARGWVVLASDAAHFYDNMNRRNPFKIVFDVGEMLEAYTTVAALADSPQHIIAGHDPLVMRRFPAASKETEGIAVRVDAQPLNWDD